MSTSDVVLWKPTAISVYKKVKIVTLVVGTEEDELAAHGSYLLTSGFFQDALRQEWREGQTPTIRLPGEQPEIVEQYLDFVYRGYLPTFSTKTDARKGAVYTVLANLFALGERLLDSVIRNAIIREIIRFTTCYDGATVHVPDTTAVNIIYDCTTAASPARRLMVDFYTAGPPAWVETHAHPTFHYDLARASLSRLGVGGRPAALPKLEASNYLV